ncbi:MAG TPA: CAP domain-containing protein [Acidobacteriaceae bacterium]|nr:CAP domain-containing protein [Acidobacteriaceae bacterium]
MKRWILAGMFCFGLVATPNHAHAQGLEARQLMQATNEDRTRHGLGTLRWDPALARAAQAHAELMIRAGALSHQYTGEADLVTRVGESGAHFRVVAENLAVGPAPQSIEVEWMHSPPHRRNILDARLDEIGIGLVRQGGNLWAVEDFATGVPNLGSSQIERQVGELLADRGVRPMDGTSAARQTCAMDHGSAGTMRPKFIMRWEGSDLSRLPDVLLQQIRTGRFRTAAVGACNSGERGQGFTTYRVAVMLY